MGGVMSHEEVADLLGAFALGRGRRPGQRRSAGPLDECPRCQAELSEHHEVAGLLAKSEETHRPRSGTG